MKKIYLLISLVAATFSVYAQSNNFPAPTGNVSILSTSPTHSLTFGSTATGIAQYNTADQTTNYERVVKSWNSNVYNIGTYIGGTGSARSLRLGVQQTAGSTTLAGGRVLTFNLGATVPTGNFDFNIGATGSVGSIMTLNSSLQQTTSGQQTEFAIQPTILQAGTSSYTALLIAPFESTVGSGSKYLIDAGTNTAASGGGTHTSKFNVGNTGSGYFAGNVSIGTTTHPTGYMLAVNGSAIATAMWVKNLVDWPDYVFKSDYQISSLNDIKTYIDKNHHLPGVPTEQDVKKNGLNLGEMNKVLLQKVEELTLYMIEKDKVEQEQKEINKKQLTELKSQQEQIDQLKQQMQLLLKNSNKN